MSLQVKSTPIHAPPMVNTKVKPVAYAIDVATPQAQRLEDVIQNDVAKLRSSTASSLERMAAYSVTSPPRRLTACNFANPVTSLQ